MPWYGFIWDDEFGGNVNHLAEHGVSPEEAAEVVMHPAELEANRWHAGRYFAQGYTRAGRKLGVSYYLVDEVTVYVITAFEVG